MAIDFDGTVQFLEVPSINPHTYGQFTMMCWYRSNELTIGPSDHYLYNHQALNGSFVRFGPTNDTGQVDKMRISLKNDPNSSKSYYGTSDVVDQTNHFLVVVRNATDILIYVDGILESTTADTEAGNTVTCDGETAPIDSKTGPFIGKRENTTTNKNPLDGVIEDLRIYDRALSTEEIQSIFSAEGCDGIKTGLLARWQMNEDVSGTVIDATSGFVKDSSENGHDATAFV